MKRDDAVRIQVIGRPKTFKTTLCRIISRALSRERIEHELEADEISLPGVDEGLDNRIVSLRAKNPQITVIECQQHRTDPDKHSPVPGRKKAKFK